MTRHSAPALGVALTLALACACGGSSGVADAGFVDAGLDARVIGRCDPDRVRPAGDTVGIIQECTSHSDCVDGVNGRCTLRGAYTVCTYDECFSDADCPAGTRCACGVEQLDGNLCQGDNCSGCAVADCALSWGCEGHNGGSDSGAQSFECYTPDDSCHTDADCDSGEYCTRGPDTIGEAVDPSWHCASPSCGP